MSKRNDPHDESSLRKLLDRFNTVICNTHHWERYDMMSDPENIVLEDDAVKKFLADHSEIFLSNKEWFLYQTFFEGKPFAFSAILGYLAPFLDEADRRNIRPFISENKQQKFESITSSNIDIYEVTKGYGIIERALSNIC